MSQKSAQWFRFEGGTRALTTALEGTGTATAHMVGNGLPTMVVDLAAAQVSKYVDITGVNLDGLEVIDAYVISGDTVNSSALINKKGTSTAVAISNAIAKGTADKAIVSASTLDDATWGLDGEDNIRLAITVGAFTGRVVIVLASTK